VCLAILSVAATLIGSGGRQVRGQADLVRVVSPRDFVLQPSNAVDGTVKLEFNFDSRVNYVWLNSGGQPFKLSATAKTLTWAPCNSGGADNPNDIRMGYTAYDSAGSRIEGGDWHFKMGPDTTEPLVRIVSPQNLKVVRPGETVDIVVAGEESKTAKTWQTGLRHLKLVDPALNAQISPETPSKICGKTQWTSEHHFRYVVPRDAEAGLIRLTAGAEDWAKNVGKTTLDLAVVPTGFGGVWTSKGRGSGPSWEQPFSIEAVFSFTLNPHTGAVECGTLAKPYCGNAIIGYGPGRTNGPKWCVHLHTVLSPVFNIVAHGQRQGNEVAFLSIQPSTPPLVEHHYVCPDKGYDQDYSGGLEVPVGSILREGLTIAIPQRPQREHTTATRQESSNGFVVDITVDLYAPR
jgi:hypothetical protein